ncbi:MAG: hybrid sensor histidine kinase/response regulator [Verrucomicrobiales bacterium]|nr:hybrid sensor histidine kinase/response regulator [Verrucomicrobiales bacterium]
MNSAEIEETILIVDDEPKNIQVVGTTLAAFGYDFMAAASGEQAVQRIEARVPDLVLLDIQMPGMDGFEVCRSFAKLPEMAGVPVIFLSANDDKNFVVRALEAGGVDYVTKPFNKAELLARVRTHLDLKRVRDDRAALLAKTERFLEVMAHDLKNWIGSASLSAQLLPEVLDKPEKANQIVETIVDSTGRSLDFISEYLTSAREAREETEIHEQEISLSAICRETAAQLGGAAQRKKISVSCQIPTDEINVISDRTALGQILSNLVANAIKFSPTDTEVVVTLAEDPLTLKVSDDGPGFSEEDLTQIFQPYTRLSAKPTAGEASTGLGLSIVKQLSDRLGIEISVDNGDRGAEITLKFPMRRVDQ